MAAKGVNNKKYVVAFQKVYTKYPLVWKELTREKMRQIKKPANDARTDIQNSNEVSWR